MTEDFKEMNFREDADPATLRQTLDFLYDLRVELLSRQTGMDAYHHLFESLSDQQGRKLASQFDRFLINYAKSTLILGGIDTGFRVIFKGGILNRLLPLREIDTAKTVVGVGAKALGDAVAKAEGADLHKAAEKAATIAAKFGKHVDAEKLEKAAGKTLGVADKTLNNDVAKTLADNLAFGNLVKSLTYGCLIQGSQWLVASLCASPAIMTGVIRAKRGGGFLRQFFNANTIPEPAKLYLDILQRAAQNLNSFELIGEYDAYLRDTLKSSATEALNKILSHSGESAANSDSDSENEAAFHPKSGLDKATYAALRHHLVQSQSPIRAFNRSLEDIITLRYHLFCNKGGLSGFYVTECTKYYGGIDSRTLGRSKLAELKFKELQARYKVASELLPEYFHTARTAHHRSLTWLNGLIAKLEQDYLHSPAAQTPEIDPMTVTHFHKFLLAERDYCDMIQHIYQKYHAILADTASDSLLPVQRILRDAGQIGFILGGSMAMIGISSLMIGPDNSIEIGRQLSRNLPDIGYILQPVVTSTLETLKHLPLNKVQLASISLAAAKFGSHLPDYTVGLVQAGATVTLTLMANATRINALTRLMRSTDWLRQSMTSVMTTPEDSISYAGKLAYHHTTDAREQLAEKHAYRQAFARELCNRDDAAHLLNALPQDIRSHIEQLAADKKEMADLETTRKSFDAVYAADTIRFYAQHWQHLIDWVHQDETHRGFLLPAEPRVAISETTPAENPLPNATNTWMNRAKTAFQILTAHKP